MQPLFSVKIPLMFTQPLLEQALKDTPVPAFRFFPSIGSTNEEALAWASTGAADFSLVLAEEQTRGRGRFNRRWHTLPGTALALSLILRPTPAETANLVLFSPLCGLAVADAVQSQTGLQPLVKWPNDVLVNRKKVCGILVESTWTGGQAGAVVLGIGLNTSRGSVPPSDEQRFPASSLEEELGSPVDRLRMLVALLNALHAWRPRLGSPEFFHAWQTKLAFVGETVRIEQSEKSSIIGIEKGINAEGHIVLVTDSGEEVSFEIGDVHLRPGRPE
jgi:BirA family transcriptional regulator, biotin operon repressor / biotin---[acetyl-CoA-carboxylase] ligase